MTTKEIVYKLCHHRQWLHGCTAYEICEQRRQRQTNIYWRSAAHTDIHAWGGECVSAVGDIAGSALVVIHLD
jgi:hypothetical protein